jgi:type I restriction enzyme S subunit
VHGACAFVESSFEGSVVSNSYSSFLGTSKCDPKYFSWLAQHPLLAGYFVSSSHGIVIEKMNFDQDYWLALAVPLPPIREQKKIAEILDVAAESIRTTERLIVKLRSQLTGMRRALFDDVNIRRLCENEVDSLPLAQTGTWLSGGTPSTSNLRYWGGDIPWISAVSLHDFYVDSSDRNLTIEGTRNGSRLIPRDTVLFIVRGMSLKKEFRVGVTLRSVAFGQDCKAIIPNSNISGNYLAHAIQAKESEILRLVDEAGNGTGRLETRLLQRVHVSLPRDIMDQQRILDVIRTLEDQLDSEQQRLVKLKTTKQGLIQDLLTGRVRVKVD